jgi:hypothetical protein
MRARRRLNERRAGTARPRGARYFSFIWWLSSVIASEAKQSRDSRVLPGICFVAALLAMTLI